VGFLSDERRINVAITRARRHLCLICDSQTCKNNEFLKSFLTYCNEHADVRSGFDYQDDSSREVVSDGRLFEDVTFSKLKTVADTPKQTTQNKDDDERFEKEVDAIVKRLLEAKNDEPVQHRFSKNLNARQRRIVHEKAEKSGLFHLSQGPENARFITLSTKPIVEEVPSQDKTTETVPENKPPKEEQPKEDVKPEKKENKSDEELEAKPPVFEIKNNFDALSVEEKTDSSKTC
jgi:ATP-dependent RNA/DNA helicase IGHMBP2